MNNWLGYPLVVAVLACALFIVALAAWWHSAYRSRRRYYRERERQRRAYWGWE